MKSQRYFNYAKLLHVHVATIWPPDWAEQLGDQWHMKTIALHDYESGGVISLLSGIILALDYNDWGVILACDISDTLSKASSDESKIHGRACPRPPG